MLVRRKAANAAGEVVGSNSLSAHLLPASWDSDRLAAELATHARRSIQQVVRDMAAESLRTGHVFGFEFDGHPVKLLIRIPDIRADDWMPEPGCRGIPT